MNLDTNIKRNPVASFILLTLGLSFAVFLLPIPPENAFTTIAFIAVLIPTIVAFALIAITDGRRGAGAFLRQSLQWRSSLKWYLSALVVGFVIHIGGSLLALLTGRISVIEIATPTVFLIALFPLALLEEIGWRGFALRRLLDRHSAFTATLIVGIPWASLHFVLFILFVPDGSPVAEAMIVFAFALLLTWIFVRSGRNVLVSTVMHGAMNAFNIAGAAIPPAEALWFVFASACLVIPVVTLIDRRLWFARPPEMTTETATASIAV